MDLEDIVPSEIDHLQKDKHYRFPSNEVPRVAKIKWTKGSVNWQQRNELSTEEIE